VLNWFLAFLFDFIHVILPRTIWIPSYPDLFVILYFPISHAIYDELTSTSTFQEGYFICVFCYDHSLYLKNLVLQTYRHKEQGFLCRSLLECERYEKHGIRPQRRVKTKEKEENSNKSKNENKVSIYLFSKYYVIYSAINIHEKLSH